LLSGAFAPSTSGRPKAVREPRSHGLGGLFLLGPTITVVEFSTALPYLGAIGLLTDADLSAAGWLPILVAYDLVFVPPPVLLVAAFEPLGGRVRHRLDGVRERPERGARTAWLTVVALLGFFLFADNLACFEFVGLVEIPDEP
jgi:cytochrome c biogenesis protein CcdA